MNATPDNTAVMTIAAYPVNQLTILTPFIRTAQARKITPIVVMLGEPYSNYYELKITRFLAEIHKLPHKYKYILYADGSDVVFQGTMQGICDKFNYIGELILMGAETGLAPFKALRTYFPQSKTPYAHPNAGVWMGEREVVVDSLEMAEKVRLLHPNDHPIEPRLGMTMFNHDQGMWHYLFLYNLIPFGVDYHAQLVLNTCAVRKRDVSFSPTGLIDLRTGSTPELIHFSTGHRQWVGKYYRYLRKVHGVDIDTPVFKADVEQYVLKGR